MKKIILFLCMIFNFEIFIGSLNITTINPYKVESTSAGKSLFFILPKYLQRSEIEVNCKNQKIALVTNDYLAIVTTDDISLDEYSDISFQRDEEYCKITCSHR